MVLTEAAVITTVAEFLAAQESDGADILRRPLQSGGGAYLLGRSLDVNGRLRGGAERAERDTEEPMMPASAAPTLTRNGPRRPLVRAPVSDAPAATTDIGSVTSPAPA